MRQPEGLTDAADKPVLVKVLRLRRAHKEQRSAAAAVKGHSSTVPLNTPVIELGRASGSRRLRQKKHQTDAQKKSQRATPQDATRSARRQQR